MQTKLFRRDFTLVVIGQIISLFGNAILRFALPLYLLRETGSSTLFGIVTACSFAPMVILSMAGEVLADRVNKRNIMVGLDFSTAAIIMFFYFSLGKIPTVPLFIVVLMLLYGISGTYQPAVQASVPLLVAKDKLMAGNAVINQVNSFPEYARYCIVLGNHFHEFHRYGCLHTLYGSNLHTGVNTDPASISRKNHGSTDFHCNVRATDWTGNLRCSV